MILYFQGIHVECGHLDLSRPRWKCPLCKPVVAQMPNKPISVFTKVKRLADPPNKEFTRNVLQNLTFRVSSNYDIDVDMHKNRRDPKDPVIVSFKVKGVPAFDIPEQVKVSKNSLDESDKVKNIPCPFENCEAVLSRVEFKLHCSEHRKEDANNVDTTCDDEKQIDNIVQNMENSEEMVDDPGNDSVEFIEEKHLSPVKTFTSPPPGKQSSILSFFKRFSPSKTVQIPAKRSKVETESDDVIVTTPIKDNSDNKDNVISSPVGYFKMDEEISLKSPVKMAI